MGDQTVIGITGGTGCGKTTALKVLEAMGVCVIDCDALYHHLLATDDAMIRAIAAAFPGVVEGGVLDRKALGRRVFSDRDALERLNKTVWPFVGRAVDAVLKEQAPRPCAVDAIGLFESGLADLCTCTVAVTAPEEARVARLMAREGISAEYARLRIGAQKSNETFSALCGVTLDNVFDTPQDFSQYCTPIFEQLLGGQLT